MARLGRLAHFSSNMSYGASNSRRGWFAALRFTNRNEQAAPIRDIPSKCSDPTRSRHTTVRVTQHGLLWQCSIPKGPRLAGHAAPIKLRGGNGIAWGSMFDWLPAFLDPPAARVIAKIAGGVILLGVVALVAAKVKYAQVANWPKTSGRILRSEPGFELRRRFKTEQPRNERVAKIAYEFEAKGKTWRSNNILDSGHPPEDQVERLLTDYPKGAPVTVFYNPSDPSKSALEIDHPPKELAIGCLVAMGMVSGWQRSASGWPIRVSSSSSVGSRTRCCRRCFLRPSSD